MSERKSMDIAGDNVDKAEAVGNLGALGVLPAELRNRVYEFLLHASAHARATEQWPPRLACVSKGLRSEYLSYVLKNAVFHVHVCSQSSRTRFYRWLFSLDSIHVLQIQKLKLYVTSKTRPLMSLTSDTWSAVCVVDLVRRTALYPRDDSSVESNKDSDSTRPDSRELEALRRLISTVLRENSKYSGPTITAGDICRTIAELSKMSHPSFPTYWPVETDDHKIATPTSETSIETLDNPLFSTSIHSLDDLDIGRRASSIP